MVKRRRAATAALLLPLAAPVAAHSPIEGIGVFYASLLHPLVVPSHLLSLVLLGLFAGQAGMGAMRHCYAGFLPALLTGIALAILAQVAPREIGLLLLSAAAGLLVALQLRLPRLLYALAGVIAGLLIGIDSGPEAGSPGQQLGAVLGTSLGACICLLLAGDLSERARGHWQRILLRVLGSWGAASALLVLALGQLRH